MTTYYLAGRMSGIPQFNFPAFREAAAFLREAGYTIISPVEMDSPEMQAFSATTKGDWNGSPESWGEVLAKDVRVVADQCDGIIFLPGWKYSKGARLEAFVALLTGKELFALYDNGKVRDLSSWDVSNVLVESLESVA